MTQQHLVRPWIHGLLDLIYPRECLLCRRLLPPAESPECLCAHCLSGLTRNHPPFCRRCGRPAGPGNATVCRHCARHRFAFDRCWSALIYDDTARHLIHLFKYGRCTALRRPFARLLTDLVRRAALPIADVDLLIPVPLHPARFRERGFNQSELLARLIAPQLRVQCSTNALKRRHYTPNQARANSKQRWTNLQGTFTIRQSQQVKNKTILIVDDVLTTGATLSEVSATLKSAGARAVYGLTLAIAV